MERKMTGQGSSCGACKFLRRKCTRECIFAPYFNYDRAADHFSAVHKVFGASNVSKLLLHLPVQTRADAAFTVSYEALARMWDPVYGCVAHIFALQKQVANLQEEIDVLETQMANVGFGNCRGLRMTDELFDSDAGSHFPHNYDPADHFEPTLTYHGTKLECNDLWDSVLDSFNGNDSQPNEGQDRFSDDSSILEILFDGVEREILALCPWLNHGKEAVL